MHNGNVFPTHYTILSYCQICIQTITNCCHNICTPTSYHSLPYAHRQPHFVFIISKTGDREHQCKFLHLNHSYCCRIWNMCFRLSSLSQKIYKCITTACNINQKCYSTIRYLLLHFRYSLLWCGGYHLRLRWGNNEIMTYTLRWCTLPLNSLT